MDQLIALVSQKTGLPAETAKLAVDTVLGFLKSKLPAPLASQIDAAIGGGGVGGALGQAGDLAAGLGGLFK